MATGCSTATTGGAEGTESGPAPTPTIPSNLSEFAEAVESQNDLLDVVQMEMLPAGNLNLHVVLENPGTQTDQDRTDAETLIKNTLESIWRESQDLAPNAQTVTVNFINLLDVQTFEYGPATSGVVTGAIAADISDVSDFLAGEFSEDEVDEFWDSEAVRSQSIGNPYTGTPNHPLRSD
jgi:hypothetical protein